MNDSFSMLLPNNVNFASMCQLEKMSCVAFLDCYSGEKQLTLSNSDSVGTVTCVSAHLTARRI